MLTKCANPECSEVFRYLHEGKIFFLSPTPGLHVPPGRACPPLHERFWLCDKCSKQMTVVWGGTQAKLVPVPPTEERTGQVLSLSWSGSVSEDAASRGRLRSRVAYAGRDDG